MIFLPNYLSMISLMFPLTDPLKHIHSAIVLPPLQNWWYKIGLTLKEYNFPIIILIIWQ